KVGNLYKFVSHPAANDAANASIRRLRCPHSEPKKSAFRDSQSGPDQFSVQRPVDRGVFAAPRPDFAQHESSASRCSAWAREDLMEVVSVIFQAPSAVVLSVQSAM